MPTPSKTLSSILSAFHTKSIFLAHDPNKSSSPQNPLPSQPAPLISEFPTQPSLHKRRRYKDSPHHQLPYYQPVVEGETAYGYVLYKPSLTYVAEDRAAENAARKVGLVRGKCANWRAYGRRARREDETMMALIAEEVELQRVSHRAVFVTSKAVPKAKLGARSASGKEKEKETKKEKVWWLSDHPNPHKQHVWEGIGAHRALMLTEMEQNVGVERAALELSIAERRCERDGRAFSVARTEAIPFETGMVFSTNCAGPLPYCANETPRLRPMA